MRWRRRRRATPSPEGPARLELRLERERYVPGETVRGSVVIPESGRAGEVEVSLNFRERSTEYEAVAVTIPSAVLDDGERPPGGARRFAVELPGDALPSQTSGHGALWWTVDATVSGSSADLVASARVDVGAPSSEAEAGASADLGAGSPLRG